MAPSLPDRLPGLRLNRVARRPRRRHLRYVAALLIAVTVLSLAHSVLTYDAAPDSELEGANGTLVVTIDGTGPGQIVAYGPDGNVAYRNESRWLYHDVDPAMAGDRSVSYVASEVVNRSHPRCDAGKCMRNVVERATLSTGAVTEQQVWYEPLGGSTQTHDVDRVNDSVVLVADISYSDRVFMQNTTTGDIIWEWRISAAFSNDSGGQFPSDWTHINDVEHLPDGRVMANLRNQDQVVFLNPGEGIQPDWTLGSDDAHGVLYEQHNADYIPESRGGPAILVADSENNRIVEYQRRDGTWEQSWVWADKRLQWPRDADRLPNGNTLVVDSHGSRLLSVAPDGSVAWSHPFPAGGYDAEMLGTGDESNGPSAVRATLSSRTPADGGASLTYQVVSLVPPLVLHGLLYALPIWASSIDAVLVLVTGPVVVLWLVVEGVAAIRRRTDRIRDAVGP